MGIEEIVSLFYFQASKDGGVELTVDGNKDDDEVYNK